MHVMRKATSKINKYLLVWSKQQVFIMIVWILLWHHELLIGSTRSTFKKCWSCRAWSRGGRRRRGRPRRRKTSRGSTTSRWRQPWMCCRPIPMSSKVKNRGLPNYLQNLLWPCFVYCLHFELLHPIYSFLAFIGPFFFVRPRHFA